MKTRNVLRKTTILAIVICFAMRGTVEAQFSVATNNGTITIIGYTGSGGNVIIPSTINGLPVAALGDVAFNSLSNLTSVALPNTLTNLGLEALASCNSLTNISVNASNQFYSSLNGVLFNKLQTTLVRYPGGLYGSYLLTNTTTIVGDYAFEGCLGLTGVTIPNSVTSLGIGSFISCSALTNIMIPNSVTNIGAWAFQSCSALTNVAISPGVTTLPIYLFYECYRLGAVSIPSTVNTIQDFAFCLCTNLNTVTIPSSVWAIYNGAFAGCYNLQKIIILGNAPYAGLSLGEGNNDPAFWLDPGTVYYLLGTSGWGTNYAGLPTTVLNSNLQITINPTNGFSPLTVNFTSVVLDNSGNTITNWNWDFGDGGASDLQNPVHTYINAGTFLPVLSAINSQGVTAFGYGTTVTVTNLITEFAMSPTNGYAPLAVSFVTPDVDSVGNSITNWSWNFGDGGTSTLQNPAHTYTNDGTFFPALTVINNQGATVLGYGPSVFVDFNGGLVINGGFETGDFTSWTTNGDTSYTFVNNGFLISGLSPHSGIYFAALGTTSTNGFLSQAISTAPGQSYLLSLWVDSPDGLTPNEFQVSWNGTTLFDETSIPAIGWTNLQFSVAATVTNTVLQFGFRDDPSYLGLDDVNVVPTPLMLSGVTIAGANLVLNGMNGIAGQTYYLLMSTNLTEPTSHWVSVATNVPPTNGNFSITVTNILSSGNQQQFYILEAP